MHYFQSSFNEDEDKENWQAGVFLQLSIGHYDIIYSWVEDHVIQQIVEVEDIVEDHIIQTIG